jgi:hypothetical protein
VGDPLNEAIGHNTPSSATKFSRHVAERFMKENSMWYLIAARTVAFSAPHRVSYRVSFGR